MKKAEVGQAVLDGQILGSGEFRDWEVREFGSNGSVNVVATSYVLIGRETIEVQQWQPKGTRKEQCTRPAFKAGERVVIHITTMERTKWGTRARGEVVKLEG